MEGVTHHLAVGWTPQRLQENQEAPTERLREEREGRGVESVTTAAVDSVWSSVEKSRGKAAPSMGCSWSLGLGRCAQLPVKYHGPMPSLPCTAQPCFLFCPLSSTHYFLHHIP